MKRLLKQRILALYHDFHWVVDATKFLTAKIHSIYVKESGDGPFGKVGVGVGHLISDSATLLFTMMLYSLEKSIRDTSPFCRPLVCYSSVVMYTYLSYSTEAVVRLDYQISPQSSPKLTDWFRTWPRRRDFTFRCNSWPTFCIFLYNGWPDEKAKVSIHKICV